jgi:prepilin-type N-terminal cleavage/methylation domain-containing protein
MNTNERGLTLAEILVATAIISIGLVGLAVVIPVASYGVQEGNQMSTATFLAEQRVEQIRNSTWNTQANGDCIGLGAPPAPSGGNTCAGSTAVTFANETTVTGFTDYSRATTITDCGVGAGCAGVVNSGMRLVRVSVTYRPLTGAGVSPTTKTVNVDWLVSQK